MSATMRTTLQTVPESLPADHVTNNTTTVQSTIQSETKSHGHSTTAALKTRSSSSKVCHLLLLLTSPTPTYIFPLEWVIFELNVIRSCCSTAYQVLELRVHIGSYVYFCFCFFVESIPIICTIYINRCFYCAQHFCKTKQFYRRCYHVTLLVMKSRTIDCIVSKLKQVLHIYVFQSKTRRKKIR
jgi:hypothetical protein